MNIYLKHYTNYISTRQIYVYDWAFNLVFVPLSSEGGFCGQINPSDQSVRYIHSCPQLAILIKMSINNRSQKSVVLELSAKPNLNCHFSCTGLVLAEDSRTTDPLYYSAFFFPGCRVLHSQ